MQQWNIYNMFYIGHDILILYMYITINIHSSVIVYLAGRECPQAKNLHQKPDTKMCITKFEFTENQSDFKAFIIIMTVNEVQ